jgi:hypothetical protein
MQSLKAHQRPLPMVHQMSLTLRPQPFDPEAELAGMGAQREDVPVGMSRFAG